MSKTATQIKRISSAGEAYLYRLSEPLAGSDFVVVSATEFGGRYETYIFPATQDGKVADWGELPGSFQGGYDHEQALANAGYEVAE